MSRQDKSQYRFFLFGKRKGRLDLYTNVAPIKAQIKDEYVISITAIPEIQVIASLRLLSNLSIKISRACATDSFNCGIEIASHRTAAAAARCNGTNSLRFPFFPCLRNECIHIQNNCNHCLMDHYHHLTCVKTQQPAFAKIVTYFGYHLNSSSSIFFFLAI